MPTAPSIVIEPLDVDAVSDDELRPLHDHYVELERELYPDDPPEPFEEWILNVRNRASIDVALHWVARDATRIVGVSRLAFETVEENRNQAWVRLSVRPAYRRHRIAARLLEPVVERARAEERTLLSFGAPFDTPGAAFLDTMGAEQRLRTRESELRLDKLDRDLMQQWVDRAVERAAGYEVRVWVDACPPDLREAYAQAINVMNTAPRDDYEEEDFVMTVERLLDQEEAAARRRDHWWTAAAIDRDTGVIAGFTNLYFSRWRPPLVWQGDTGVEPAHRNRGLGRWLKATLALKLLDEKPEAKVVRTWNAGSNDAMLGINIAMGFEVLHWWGNWQVQTERLTSSVRERLEGERAG